jgi:putative oxidoreductase
MKTPSGQEPALFIPRLRRFYDYAIPLSWVVVRLGVGWNLAVHGYGKWLRGMEAQTKALDVTMPWAQEYNFLISHLLLVVEGVGGLCIMLGLFTRFWAAANALEMGFLTFVIYWGTGFSWLNRGYEYTLLWGFMCLAIALRGGGPWSADRLLGKEL